MRITLPAVRIAWLALPALLLAGCAGDAPARNDPFDSDDLDEIAEELLRQEQADGPEELSPEEREAIEQAIEEEMDHGPLQGGRR